MGDKVSKRHWENITNRLAQLRVAANLQFIKHTVSAEGNIP